MQPLLPGGARGGDFAVGVEHALACARCDKVRQRVLVPQDCRAQVHVRVADAVQHRVPKLDVAVSGDRPAQGALVVGAACEVAVDHGVRPLLGSDAQVVDVRGVRNPPLRRPVQDGHENGPGC